MTRWMRWVCLVLGASVAAAGCHTSTAAVSVTITPSAATVLLNNAVQFSAAVSNSTETVTWSVNTVNGGNSTVGTINTSGLYTAPSSIPPNTTITVGAAVQNTSATASATVTLVSGLSVTVTPSTFTIGTGETLPFFATVTGVPFNAVTSTCNSANPSSGLPLCTAVTWTITGSGTINSSTGLYTAPGTATTATITATSIYDSSATANATVTVVAGADPTLTSVSPRVGALGAVFQDIYLTGTNFISTTSVFVNGAQISPSAVVAASSTVLRVRVSDLFLSTRPAPPSNTVTLSFTAGRQGGTQQQCSPDPTTCQVVLSPVRAAIAGTAPDSVPQVSGSAVGFTIDGGFFGTPSNPTVITQFAGQPRSSTVSSTNPDRQLSMILTAADVATPGLFPVSVLSNVAGSSVPPVVANLAVQPAYGPSAVTPVVTLPVGVMPSAVAVNTATGVAVVANQGSDDVTLIDLTQSPPRVLVPSICTAARGLAPPCPAGSAGPTGVAVDNLRNLALVANSKNNTVAVIDLTAQSVRFIISTATIGEIPASVGINPVTGRAIIAYESTNNATLLDLTPWPGSTPAVAGTVSVSTGINTRVAVSPKLNWALVSPGGAGVLSIVDLSQQTVTPIAATGVSRVSGTVTVTTTQSHALQIGEAVLIQGVGDSSFNGITTVVSTPSNTTFTYSQATTLPNANSGGGTASYGLPVATVSTNGTLTGVALDDETGKALIVDPAGGVPAAVFNLLDQSSVSVSTLSGAGYIGAAFNPLANIAVAVNDLTNQVSIVNPDPANPTILTSFSAGNKPFDVAIDPGTDIAVIANQADNTATIISLAALRSAPQILQANLLSSLTSGQLLPGASVIVHSTLSSSTTPTDQTLVIIGKGFTGGATARLDGTPLATLSASDRMMTVNVPAAMQSTPRRYALDVVNSLGVSNASSFTVMQSVDVGGTCSNPSPLGVSIDAPNNLALVTDVSCNDVYLVNLLTGMGQAMGVGANPEGVAASPLGGTAVVADTGAQNASIVDDINADVIATIGTAVNPTGVAIDAGLGQVAVTNSGGNTVSLFPITAATGAAPTSLAVMQSPTAIAVDPSTHRAAVGNLTSGNVSLVDLSQVNATLQSGTIQIPQGIVFDPVSGNFVVAASLQNQAVILDQITGTLTSLRVGINPTSIAYNFDTSTLITTNSLGQSMTVVDFLNRQVRSVFRMTPSSEFSVDIHPFTNLAVIADSANQRILLLPLPQ